MNERRKVSANDIISGVDNTPKSMTDDQRDTNPHQDDVKTPGGLHPIVAERLSRDRVEQPIQNPYSGQTNNMPQQKGDYITRDEMNRFVENLNVQLAEISKWVNMVVQNDKTYKSAIMNIQGNLATLQSRINNLHRQ